MRLALGTDGCAGAMTVAGRPCAVVDHARLNGGGVAVTIPARMPLKAAVALRGRGATSLIVVDERGAVLGVAGDAEIFSALVRG